MRAPRLEVLDPDLPLLASQAAVELDNKALGQAVSFVAVKQLADALKNSFAPFGVTSRKSLVDPGAMAVISRALHDASWTDQPATVDELSAIAWELASTMDQMDNGASISDLNKVRDFCVALSSVAASYRQAVSDVEPVPPYRR